jgi:hypothetical protein
LLFRLSTLELTIVVFAVVVGTTLVGVALGRYLRDRGEGFREPFGVVQAALVGFVALILAFGLSMAVGATKRDAPRSSTKPTPSGRRTCARRRYPSRSAPSRWGC